MMAKNRYQKRSGGGSVCGLLKAFAAVLLVGVLAAGVCCIGYATRNDVGKWFGLWHWADRTPAADEPENPDEGKAPDDVQTPGGENPETPGGTDENPEEPKEPVFGYLMIDTDNVVLTSLENSETVTVTVYAENGQELPAEYQQFDYYFAFEEDVNENAGDYVALEIEGNTVSVTLLREFTNPILLTCTNTIRNDFQAVIHINCAPQVAGIKVTNYSTLEECEVLIGDNYSSVSVQAPYSNEFGSGTWDSLSLNLSGNAIYADSPCSAENVVVETYTDISFSDNIAGYFENLYSKYVNGSYREHIQSCTFIGAGVISLNDIIRNIFDEEVISAFMSEDDNTYEAVLTAISSVSNEIDVSVTLTMAYGAPVTINYSLDISFIEWAE